MTIATGLLLGLLLGFRHALEPDHLAAVSVLVARQGKASAGAVLGAIWGSGHALALFVVGCTLAAVGSRLPSRLADGFELLVGAMLVTLGMRAILRATIFNGVDARPDDRRTTRRFGAQSPRDPGAAIQVSNLLSPQRG